MQGTYVNGALKYTTNYSGSWVITTIDNSADVGSNSGITVGLDGYIHISYFDNTNNRVKICHEQLRFVAIDNPRLGTRRRIILLYHKRHGKQHTY